MNRRLPNPTRTATSTAIHTLLAGVLVAGCAMSSPRSDALDSLAGLDDTETETSVAVPAVSDPSTTTTTTTTIAMSASERACTDADLATASYRPDADGNVDDAFVEEIRRRGFLEVGVDKNTLGFSLRDPASGTYGGFEVDLAHEIARRIFGPDYRSDMVHFVPVGSSQKRPLVRDGTVDFTISANTMTCERWEEVAFSSEYYTANQQFLVHADSELRTVDDLAGATVCVTDGSSSQGILESLVPAAVPIVVDERIDCLVEMQEGRADAYFGHDSFQYGMMAQHPGLEMRSILPADVTVSHYGIAIALDHPGFVRFVNGVLAEVRADGTWQALHEQLEDEDGPNIPPADGPPIAKYRD